MNNLLANRDFLLKSYVPKYIIKMNKNNTCIYNYTGVYYFLSEKGNDC